MTLSSPSQVRVVRVPATLRSLAQLAALLERIERSGCAPDPDQYRHLVSRLRHELLRSAADPGLAETLALFPSAAELYENLRYEVAGLCLHPLDDAVATEQQAREALQAFRR